MKHMATTAITVMSLLALSAPSQASDDDVFMGPWAGNCGAHVQCTVDFIPSEGGAYQMEFRVSSALDDNAVICSASIRMKPLAFDTLVADEADGSILAVLLRTNEVVLGGLDGKKCQGADVNTSYRLFDDE